MEAGDLVGSNKTTATAASFDTLPDEPLENVLYFVPPSSRNSVSLISRRFYLLESLTRFRLVFRSPREALQQTTSPCTSEEQTSSGGGSPCHGVAAACCNRPVPRCIAVDEVDILPAALSLSCTPQMPPETSSASHPVQLLNRSRMESPRVGSLQEATSIRRLAEPGSDVPNANSSQEGPVPLGASHALQISGTQGPGGGSSEKNPRLSYPVRISADSSFSSDSESEPSPKRLKGACLPGLQQSISSSQEDDQVVQEKISPAESGCRQLYNHQDNLVASDPGLDRPHRCETYLPSRQQRKAFLETSEHPEESDCTGPQDNGSQQSEDKCSCPSKACTCVGTCRPIKIDWDAGRTSAALDKLDAGSDQRIQKEALPVTFSSRTLLVNTSSTSSMTALGGPPLDASYTAHHTHEAVLRRLLRRFSRLRSIHLCDLQGGTQGDDQALLNAVAELAPCLEELSVSGRTLGWTVSETGLEQVARRCESLRKLIVHHWLVGKEAMAAFADAGILEELEMDFFARDHAGVHSTIDEVARCHSLTSLHLRYCSDIDIQVLAQGLPSLTRLTLLFSVLGPGLAALGQHCPQLRDLTLRSCDAGPFEDPLRHLARTCTSLQSLCLYAGHAVTEAGLVGLVAASPQLSLLTLEFQPLRISLDNVAPQLTRLVELRLQWIQHAQDSDLVALSQNCKRLKILVLSLRCTVSDQGVVPLLQGSGPTLEVLSLRVSEATDVSLEALANSCPLLQRLTLSSRLFTDSGITRLLSRFQDRTLKRLRLLDSSSLGDACLEHLDRHCPLLEGFCLKGCSLISPEAAQSLVLSCRNLVHLELEPHLITSKIRKEAASRHIELVEST